MLDPMTCLAIAIYFEARGEPDDDIYPGAIICASFNAG